MHCEKYPLEKVHILNLLLITALIFLQNLSVNRYKELIFDICLLPPVILNGTAELVEQVYCVTENEFLKMYLIRYSVGVCLPLFYRYWLTLLR